MPFLQPASTPAVRVRDGGHAQPANAAEWDRLLAWLDDGNRAGRRGRLLAEYPGRLTREHSDRHRVVRSAGGLVSHAYRHGIQVTANGAQVPIGLIGLVYTDPAARGRGFAGACVEASVAALQDEGAVLALLWSDRWDFYRRLGFEPAGVERQVRIDPPQCKRALRDLGTATNVRDPIASDWPALDRLHARRRSRALRPEGFLAAQTGVPDCRFVVAENGGEPIAYTAVGRGDDLQGVVHDWAGSPLGVLSCLRALASETSPLVLLAGPEREAVVDQLLLYGAPIQNGCLGLVRLLDAAALWDRLVVAQPELARFRLEGPYAGAKPFRFRCRAGVLKLSTQETLALLFGRQRPDAVSFQLRPGEARCLNEQLPWPLFVWGFDSV
ncbi:MAG: GNAT family N-acetyltransferase [Proteobacteria bacterium]|nr:GNAT family N-acetyltransferase [Pseudomonadota bacterium]